MIIRILTEGQYDVPASEMGGLNVFDEKLQEAINGNDEARFSAALAELLGRVPPLARFRPPTCWCSRIWCCPTPTQPFMRCVTCSVTRA